MVENISQCRGSYFLFWHCQVSPYHPPKTTHLRSGNGQTKLLRLRGTWQQLPWQQARSCAGLIGSCIQGNQEEWNLKIRGDIYYKHHLYIYIHHLYNIKIYIYISYNWYIWISSENLRLQLKPCSICVFLMREAPKLSIPRGYTNPWCPRGAIFPRRCVSEPILVSLWEKWLKNISCCHSFSVCICHIILSIMIRAMLNI